jgi:hypothetical protein
MSEQTLKDMLKPPFMWCIDGNIYDLFNNIICFIPSKDTFFRKYIEDALNEKWERDFGEPMLNLLPDTQ